MTEDLDDPFIQDLIESFGGDGYMVYFGTISLICKQQNKNNLTGMFRFSSKFLRGKFQVSAKKLSTIYQFCANYSKLSYTFSDEKFSVSIPKILDIADDWTKKLRSSSEVAPKILLHEVRSKKKEVEEYKHIACGKNSNFEMCWEKYPRKAGNKKKAQSCFEKTVNSDAKLSAFLDKMESYVASVQEAGFLKHGETFFRNWNDIEIDTIKPSEPKTWAERELDARDDKDSPNHWTKHTQKAKALAEKGGK